MVLRDALTPTLTLALTLALTLTLTLSLTLTLTLTLTPTLALTLALTLILTLSRYCSMNIDPAHNRCDVPQEPDDATGDQFTDQHVAKKARPSMWARLTSFTSWLIGHGPGA